MSVPDHLTVTPEGYLSFTPIRQSVPPMFWDRVRDAAKDAGLTAELRAAYEKRREAIREERMHNPWWGAQEEMDAEQEFFRVWVRRLFSEPDLWPWQRGWTEAMVGTYLTRRREAA